MAGDWLRIDEGMPDKPEVFHIATALDIDADAVAGKLIRVWAWASRNCHGDGVTKTSSKRAIDRAAGMSGFSDAMVDAGWLLVEGDELRFPNFDRHNSKTAKERGLAFLRKQKERHGPVTEVSRSKRDKNVTKETETETEKKEKAPQPPKGEKARFDPLAFEFPESLSSSPVFRAAWASWVKYRVERRKPLTETMCREQLLEFQRAGPAESERAIREAIWSGWQGVFPKAPGAVGGSKPTAAEHNKSAVEEVREQLRERAERRNQAGVDSSLPRIAGPAG